MLLGGAFRRIFIASKFFGWFCLWLAWEKNNKIQNLTCNFFALFLWEIWNGKFLNFSWFACTILKESGHVGKWVDSSSHEGENPMISRTSIDHRPVDERQTNQWRERVSGKCEVHVRENLHECIIYWSGNGREIIGNFTVDARVLGWGELMSFDFDWRFFGGKKWWWFKKCEKNGTKNWEKKEIWDKSLKVGQNYTKKWEKIIQKLWDKILVIGTKIEMWVNLAMWES